MQHYRVKLIKEFPGLPGAGEMVARQVLIYDDVPREGVEMCLCETLKDLLTDVDARFAETMKLLG